MNRSNLPIAVRLSLQGTFNPTILWVLLQVLGYILVWLY